MDEVRKIATHLLVTEEMLAEARRYRKALDGFTYRQCPHCNQTIEQGPSGDYWHLNLGDSLSCPWPGRALFDGDELPDEVIVALEVFPESARNDGSKAED